MVHASSGAGVHASATHTHGSRYLAGDFSNGVAGIRIDCAAADAGAISAAHRTVDWLGRVHHDLGSDAAADETDAALVKSSCEVAYFCIKLTVSYQ